MNEKQVKTEFEGDQFKFAYPDGIDGNFWNFARNKILLNKVQKLKNRGKILDIGCGRAVVADHLFKNGIDILGVELGKTTPINDSKVKVLYETNAFELEQTLREQIHTITLFDVLEHIDEPVAFLTAIRTKFPNLKNILLTVPAFNELWSDFDDYYGHIKRYDRKKLEEEVDQAKMKVNESTYFFNSLYVAIRISNLLNKGKRQLKFTAPQGFVSKLINRVIGYCFYLEFFILPKSIKGSSLFAVIKVRE